MENVMYELLISGDKVVAWLGAFLVGVLIKYVVGRISHETAKSIADRAVHEVANAVGEVWQTYVSALKEANADGKLTAEEKAEAKSRAIGIAKSNIGAKGLARLARILGMDSVDSWLSSKVESSVVAVNQATKASASPLP